jgi:hypothetical protein
MLQPDVRSAARAARRQEKSVFVVAATTYTYSLFFVIGFKFAEGPVRWRASLSRRIARVDSFSSQSSGDLEGELTPTRLRWGANPGFMPTGYKLCPFAVSLFFKSLDRFSVSR